jgi:16S rRNA (cytosine967-C5)-methyltransferase
MRLAYGTVQRRLTLDHVIEMLSDRPPRRLDPAVLAALRMGTYELLYSRGAPDRAVVHDAVELARGTGSAGHGLVNAVLRRAAREGPALLESLGEDTPELAATKHSLPQWLAQRWFAELGAEQARALMACANEPAETAVRANTLVTSAAALSQQLLPLSSHADPLLAEALVLDGPFDAQRSPLWAAGQLHSQSRASMLVARVVDPQPGERVLDLCAAPGGKTTHLAALMSGQGEIVAVERDRKRAGALARNAERLHARNVRVELADAAVPLGKQAFDRVLVDPPCSGLGTLQSHPDLRWRIDEARISELVAAQARILDAGARALRPGGVLVYSTCTISADENERLIAAFLDSNPDFCVDDLGGCLPALRHPSASELVLTLPHRDRTQGFFIARLRRS